MRCSFAEPSQRASLVHSSSLTIIDDSLHNASPMVTLVHSSSPVAIRRSPPIAPTLPNLPHCHPMLSPTPIALSALRHACPSLLTPLSVHVVSNAVTAATRRCTGKVYSVWVSCNRGASYLNLGGS